MIFRFAYLIFFCCFNLSTSYSQNLISDPDFNEPIENAWNLRTPCSFYSDSIFNSSSRIWWSDNGSPDILEKRFRNCPNHMSKLKGKCLGIELIEFKRDTDQIYFETISTELNANTEKNKIYSFEVDLFLNSNLFYKSSDINSIITDYINLILINSKNTIDRDTLKIPVSLNSYKDWTTIRYSFLSKSTYDIIQFAYIPEENGQLVKNETSYLYAYLDNFYLAGENLSESGRNKKDKTNILTLSYYFDTNVYQLNQSDEKILFEKIEQVKYNIDSIEVIGFTDSIFTIDYNQYLSKRRSDNISEMLKVSLPKSISVKSIGNGIDALNNGEKARRVDVVLFGTKNEIAPWYRTGNNQNSTINKSFYSNAEKIRVEEGLPQNKRLLKNIKLSKKAYDAKNIILASAKKTKILIINEAHYLPQNRAFIQSLLTELRAIKYNHLAVEALEDSENLHSLTIKDPTFYRYLLQAKNLGIELHSYDNKSFIEPNWDDVLTKWNMDDIKIKGGFESIGNQMNLRDYNQFLMLEKIIDALRNDEKIIIHVGHGHGSKFQNGFWKPLGAYLVEKYGETEVLSIDQVSLNECISVDNNDYNIYYQQEKSFVPSKDMKPYVEKRYEPMRDTYIKMCDLQIVHPKEIYDTSSNKTIDIDHKIKEVDYPILVLIYKEKDDPKTDLAFSIVEIESREEIKPSIVPIEGKYNVFIKDRNNKFSQLWY